MTSSLLFQSRLAAGILGIFIAGLACTGCNKPFIGSNVRSNGVIVLNESDIVARSNQTTEFHAFDGVYPDGWPAWLVLPKEYYLSRKGAIFVKSGTNPEGISFKTMSAHGLMQKRQADIIKYYKSIFEDQKLICDIESGEVTELIVKQPTSNIRVISIILGNNSEDNTLTTVNVRVFFNYT